LLFVDVERLCALASHLVDERATAAACIAAVLDASVSDETVGGHRFTDYRLLADDVYDGCVRRGVVHTLGSARDLFFLKDNQLPLLFRGPVSISTSMRWPTSQILAEETRVLGLAVAYAGGCEESPLWQRGSAVVPVGGIVWWMPDVRRTRTDMDRFDALGMLLRSLAQRGPIAVEMFGVTQGLSGATLEVTPLAIW